MLQNNSTALEAVRQLSGAEILEKIKKAGLYSAGAEAEPVADMLVPCTCIAGALNNADCDGVLADIAALNPAGVIAGLLAACKAAGAERAELLLPESRAALKDRLLDTAKQAGLALTVEISDMADVRAHKADVFVHLVTLAAVAELFTGGQPAAVLFVDGNLRELPFGAPLRTLFPAEGARAVCINHHFYASSILDEALKPDFALGSGVLRVLGDNDCVVKATRDELMALRQKSCGKCLFCREGLYQLTTIFGEMTEAHAKAADPDLAVEIGEAMRVSAACTLGKTAGEPAVSTCVLFRDEVDSHVKGKSCPSGECKAFLTLYIDPALCQGSGECMAVCPADCIEGKNGFISMIDTFACIKCGKCVDACPENAVKYAGGSRLPSLPERLTRVGRFRRR